MHSTGEHIRDHNTLGRMPSTGAQHRVCHQRTLRFAGHISAMFKKVFQERQYIDVHVETLIQHVNGILDARPSNEVRFALIGHMGCGKSSLINAILGVFEIARKDGSSGFSCTWSIQEFRRPFPHQTAPFRAEILFYDEIELDKLFATMVSELLRAIASETTRDAEQQEDDEVEKVAKRGAAHIKTFQALFHDKPEFATDDATKEFISQAEGDRGKDVVSRMIMWAEELIRKAETNFQSTTPSELLQQMRNYTHGPVDCEDDEHVFWPLIKKVTFGITGCPVLEDGVILVDMPGSHDSNSIQALTSRRALKECNYYVPTAAIIRALSDDTLNDFLEEGFRRKRVFVVLTKIDDIDTSLSGRQAELTARLSELQERRLRARREGKAQEKAAIVLLEEEVEDELRLVRAEESPSTAIMERNSKVANNLIDDYKRRTGDQRPLDVFPVCSKMSEQYQRGFAAELDLTDEQTGISALHDHLIKTTLEGRFNDVKYLYQDQLPLVLGRIELWCDKRHFARKDVLEKTVEEPATVSTSHTSFRGYLTDRVQRYATHIDSFLEDANGRVQELLDGMKGYENAWIKRASKLCDDWEAKYTTTQYASLVKAFGVKKKMRHLKETNCNIDLALIVKRNMASDVELLTDFADRQKLRMIALFKEPLSRMEVDLRNHQEIALFLPRSLLQQFGLHKKAMVVPLDKCFTVLREDLRNIGRDLTTTTGDSIIMQCMNPVYVEVMNIKGRGSGIRRPRKMQECVDRLWPDVREQAKFRYTKAFRKCSEGLSAVVETILEDIQDSFDAFCQEKKFEEPGEIQLRKELAVTLTKANEIYFGPFRKIMGEYKMNMLPEGVKKEEH
ncbi:hypothetical protein D6C92_08929 [Aureobasidium pullulans]|uniref:DUF7605 domain-containing protein n=1 Tax=Aureobasidium pullulans TaxID=5580 RepID=A0A4S8SUV9_AURPU|nr:hypothetical protein D6D28_02372 [Aureobasidium pullulans]THY85306.1 hypothetical protein D6C92_08929 [Aureobasidium pullulans]